MADSSYLWVGEIVAREGGSELNKTQWIDLIDRHPDLVRPPPREIINPFTKKPAVVRPTPDTAWVVVNGQRVGEMAWFPNEANGVYVYGDPTVIFPIAEGIAESLNGRFVMNRSR